jgi:phosphohistidine phosphatase SixA
MLELANRIKHLLGPGNSISIVSSAAPRASQSAEVLSTVLGVPFETHDILWSDNRHSEDEEAAYNIIKSKETDDIVVAVTHLEYSRDLPSYFAKRNNWGVRVAYEETEKGHAWVLDCTNQKVSRM